MKNKDKLFIILLIILIIDYITNILVFSKTFAIFFFILASLIGVWLIIKFGDEINI